MTKRGDTEAVKLFDEMQQHWQRAADAEVAFVGSAWGNGSGANEAFPKHRFKVYFIIEIYRDKVSKLTGRPLTLAAQEHDRIFV